MVVDKQNLMTEAGIIYQNKIAGRFKKDDLQCEVLDRERKDKMPDFYVYIKGNKKQGFICEIKSIISGGPLENGKYHLSIRDPELMEHITLDLNNPDNPKNKEIMEYNYGPIFENLKKKLEERLNEALQQYESLIKHRAEYKHYPFVVAICEDFYAEILNSYNPKEILNNRPEISAVIRREKNYEMRQIQRKHLNEINVRNYKKNLLADELVKNWEKDYEGVPDAVRFRVWLNSKAKIKFKPKEFFRNPIIDYNF